MPYKISKNQRRTNGRTRYHFYLQSKNKKYRKTVVVFKTAVEKCYHEWVTTILDGSIENRSRMFFETLDEYLNFVKGRRSKDYYQTEKRSVKLFKMYFDDMELNNFKKAFVQDFQGWRLCNSLQAKKEKVSNVAVNRNIGTLSRFFRYCIDREYYNKINPAHGQQLKESVREIKLNPGQIEELFNKAKIQDKESDGGMIYTAVQLALFAGLRRGEIIGLKWSDIDFNNNVISLSASMTKTNKARSVPIFDFLRDHLQEIRKHSPFSEKVLNFKTQYALIFQWRKLRATLSFREINNLQLRFHDLRHVYGQILLETGIGIEDIRWLMGHSSSKVTEARYVHFPRTDLHEKINRIGELIPISAVN